MMFSAATTKSFAFDTGLFLVRILDPCHLFLRGLMVPILQLLKKSLIFILWVAMHRRAMGPEK